jgi:hypothetical protein
LRRPRRRQGASGGTVCTAFIWSARPSSPGSAGRGAYRNDSAFGAKSHIEGFDSAGGWALDDDGRPQRPRDAAAARLISERYRLLRLYWRTDAAAVVAWDGRGDDGDGSFDIVRVTPPGGRPFALLIDSRTHGIRACRLALDDGLNLTEHYSRYRRVAGLLLPFRIELTADDPGIFGDEDFSRIEVDVPLAEQATRPPH